MAILINLAFCFHHLPSSPGQEPEVAQDSSSPLLPTPQSPILKPSGSSPQVFVKPFHSSGSHCCYLGGGWQQAPNQALSCSRARIQIHPQFSWKMQI